MEHYHFSPRVSVVGRVTGTVPQHVIAEEPMLFSASLDFAESFGGPLTRAALREMLLRPLPPTPEGFTWIIDSRTHMLMPGQIPAIPGWHCDGVPRPSYYTQPDMTKLSDDVWNYVVFVSSVPGGVSRTQFVNQPETIDVDEGRVWQSVHEYLQNKKTIANYNAEEGEIISFNMPTIHRATPATQRGWRWWMRLSMLSSRPLNRIRKQVQVYTVTEGGGW